MRRRGAYERKEGIIPSFIMKMRHRRPFTNFTNFKAEIVHRNELLSALVILGTMPVASTAPNLDFLSVAVATAEVLLELE